MGDYVLHIELDDTVIANASSDTFCIAKKVNNAYTVIFASGSVVPKKPEIKRMTDHSKFEWKDKYQVFFAAKYKAGLLVEAHTKKKEIKYGQIVKYDSKEGKLNPESHQGDPTTVLTPKHEYALYWSNSSETTSMVAKTLTPSYTISFGEGENSKTLRYGCAAKDQKDGNEQFGWYG
ncbi:hypothetical protein TWF751_008329 [Orbilia oligospora]|nr:hypothetical protein TWF751_008329 [Orbilia oligospora]KAF3246189.1 hypothetical protein TWF128_009001 [Orbilia oligospora]